MPLMHPQTRRNENILARYKDGQSLREIGSYFDISHQRVHAIILRHAPELMRVPHVGMNQSPQERRRSVAR
jgi:predicted DNA-binding protein YlxM (UPF0122 family)